MEKGRSKSLRLSGLGDQKLIPRDISESLGKLPPQNLDAEEAVLGAVMLESPALAKVVSLLQPDHFYMEAHNVIFAAVLALKADGSPIDMRTVVNQLKKSGHIELVGGQYKIMELTSKVSSSANIEAHAQMIVEAAVKRELIQIASNIHHNAYEDTTDAWKLLEKTVDELVFFQKNATPENSESKIKAFWENALVTVRPPHVAPLLTINGVPIATQGNHSLLVGKKKSRKTLFVAWLISQYLTEFPDNASQVLLFDTEQGREDVWLLREKIHTITGLYVPTFYMRGLAPAERQEKIADTVKHWASPPKLIVIDGIRDLMSNINDPDESTNLIVWLEKITLEFNVHVINILHLNKTDNNARGHIGSELLNKAQVTIELELDEKNNCTNVKCESSRGKPFDTFSFTHDANDLPVVIGVQVGREIIAVDEKRKRLEMIFEDGPLGYSELIDSIKDHFAVGISRAGHLLTEFQRHGWIMKNGKAKAQGTVYKLLTAVNGYHKPEPLQTALDLNVDTREIINTDELPF